MKEKFEELVNINKKLRKECPWDRKQDFNIFKETVVNEAKEVANAIEKKDYENLKEELGDLLQNIVFISSIAEDKNLFTLKEVLHDIIKKLIRRHPHIFGNEKAETPEDVVRLWEKVKESERNG